MTTPTSPFTKPSTTYDQQVAILRQRGMRVDDEESAKFYLQHLNYYRLSAYWLPFEISHNPHQFHPGTRKLYNALVIILHCMDVVSPNHSWRDRLLTLLDQHKIPVADMGFPAHWEKLPIWR